MPRSPDPMTRGSRFVALAAICVVTAALYFAKPVLVPLALAVLLSFLLAPLVNRLERLGLHRVIAVVLLVALVMVALVGIGWIVAQQVGNLARNLPEYEENVKAKIRRVQGPADEQGVIEKFQETVEDIGRTIATPATTQAATTQAAATTQEGAQPQPGTTTALAVDPPPPADIPPPVVEAGPPTTQPVATVAGASAEGPPIPVTVVPPKATPIEVLRDYVGLILGPLGVAGIVIVFVIFMLLQREDLRDRLIRLVGGGQLNLTTQALDDAASRISRYLVAVAIVNGTYGVAIAAGLWGIGQWFGGDKPFPSVVLWGLLCALLRFIPYVGPWIAAAFPITIALAAYDGFSVFVATCVMFIVVELLSNNFMEPLLYGASTGISTVAVLVSAVFWTWLWGPIGLVLATPLTVCLVVIGKYVPQLQFLDIMLGDTPVLEPPAKVYQRLLAMDVEEVSDLIDELLETQSLEEVYDTVLIPALAMAEDDRHRGRLDDPRHTFIRQSMRDLIEELGDRVRAEEARSAAARTVEQAQGRPSSATGTPAATGNGKPVNGGASDAAPSASGAARPPRSRIPRDRVINVVCLPSHDEADEIVATMLAQLLELRGYSAHYTSVDALASEMVQLVEKKEADIACISALPPAAVTHSRYLCKRLRGKFAELPIVVGLWTFKRDLKRATARIACDKSVTLTTTLGQALDEIHQMAQPLLVKAEA